MDSRDAGQSSSALPSFGGMTSFRTGTVLRIESSPPFSLFCGLFGVSFPCVTLVLTGRSKLVERSSQRQDWSHLNIRGRHERAAARVIGIAAVQALGTRAKPVRVWVPLNRKINQPRARNREAGAVSIRQGPPRFRRIVFLAYSYLFKTRSQKQSIDNSII